MTDTITPTPQENKGETNLNDFFQYADTEDQDVVEIFADEIDKRTGEKMNRNKYKTKAKVYIIKTQAADKDLMGPKLRVKSLLKNIRESFKDSTFPEPYVELIETDVKNLPQNIYRSRSNDQIVIFASNKDDADLADLQEKTQARGVYYTDFANDPRWWDHQKNGGYVIMQANDGERSTIMQNMYKDACKKYGKNFDKDCNSRMDY